MSDSVQHQQSPATGDQPDVNQGLFKGRQVLRALAQRAVALADSFVLPSIVPCGTLLGLLS